MGVRLPSLQKCILCINVDLMLAFFIPLTLTFYLTLFLGCQRVPLKVMLNFMLVSIYIDVKCTFVSGFYTLAIHARFYTFMRKISRIPISMPISVVFCFFLNCRHQMAI
uniref:Uncharacterized protein n=1 Tax=Schistocephalus solidus TaxID=70667 RepID=A0A0X3NQL1_SCHSO